jgi:hypothetical protein
MNWTKVIREGKYETAVRVKDKNETVNIFFRTTGKNQSDMIIVSKGEKRNVNYLDDGK